MYCSISDAWSQENTMANLAERFNKEYFSNNAHQQIEHFKVNDDIQENEIYGNDINNSNHGNIIQKPNVEPVSQIKNIPTKILNTNVIVQKNSHNFDNKVVVKKEDQGLIVKKYSCVELVNKVLSCDKCRNMILQRLNVNNTSLTDTIHNFFKGTNKEIIILILIGLIIIILLDLFLRIGRSLN